MVFGFGKWAFLIFGFVLFASKMAEPAAVCILAALFYQREGEIEKKEDGE